jgi:hypothetical protein
MGNKNTAPKYEDPLEKKIAALSDLERSDVVRAGQHLADAFRRDPYFGKYTEHAFAVRAATEILERVGLIYPAPPPL